MASVFREIARDNPPVPREQLEALILEYQATGSKHTLEKIFKATSRFLFKKAINYVLKIRDVHADDFMLPSFMALKDAAKNFNPDTGFTFLTFLDACARKHFWTECNTGGLIHIPRQLVYARYALTSGSPQLREKYVKFEETIRSLPHSFLFTALLKEGEHVDEAFQMFTVEENPEAFYIKQIEHTLKQLDEKEQKVVLGVLNGSTNKQIGESINVTRQRVEQLLARIYEKIFKLQQEEENV